VGFSIGNISEEAATRDGCKTTVATKSDDVLEAAREKLANSALSRMMARTAKAQGRAK
jgi:hypothetical protein